MLDFEVTESHRRAPVATLTVTLADVKGQTPRRRA
jgi:hypothetical protein